MTVERIPRGGAVLVGGGGHAVVVAEAAKVAGIALAGFLDDDPDPPLKANLRKIGKLSGLDHPDMLAHHEVMLALGDIATRRALIPRLPADLVTVIHPSAWVSSTATIGGGVFIGPHAVVHAGAVIRDHAIINTGAIVEHDCDIGENAHLAPGAVLGGTVRVGADALVGLGARAIPGVRIGAGCAIGAGSVVIRDIPDGATVMGVPAKAVSR